MNAFIDDENIDVIPEVLYLDEWFRSYFIDVNGGDSIPFNNLEELSTQIKLYETDSRTRPRITKSNPSIGYRKYVCVCCSTCQFRATFSKRRIDQQLILKSNYLYHNHS